MRKSSTDQAPFPYFGAKRDVAELVWRAFGKVSQYNEPFCGSAAMLLGAPRIAPLEVIGDASGFVANFWRAAISNAAEVARYADYPVSHVDLGARHAWLMAQRERLASALHDAEWPGDHKVAGWWLWGQCAWIGSGWCEWERSVDAVRTPGQVPHLTTTGQGVQARGKVPEVSITGRKIHAASDAPGGAWTSAGRVADAWLRRLAARLERVRVLHGDWTRCLNVTYGQRRAGSAVFLDPPYRGFESPYAASPIADDVAAWALANPELKIALCGHVGDYELPGWQTHQWQRGGAVYSSTETRAAECIWFSPACASVGAGQLGLAL